MYFWFCVFVYLIVAAACSGVKGGEQSGEVQCGEKQERIWRLYFDHVLYQERFSQRFTVRWVLSHFQSNRVFFMLFVLGGGA